MKILLFGEYSNLHHTLCEALRRAGHEVVLVSDGDGWKDYPRDIDLRRRQPGPLGSLRYLAQLAALLPRLRGFDVVQLINPVFLDVKPRWNRWVFSYLRRFNKLVSVGCFGDDYYVISRMQDDHYLRYTDFFAHGRAITHELNRQRIATWVEGPKAELTRHIMSHAGCLIACLYEYWRVYDTPEFRHRLHYIPLPVETAAAAELPTVQTRTRILFAAQKRRAQMKGTDLLEPLFDRLAAEHPDTVTLQKIVSVPFADYQRLVAEADVVVDQLYSFTPAMAALESMSQGKVVVSGYEPEYAQFLHGTATMPTDEEAMLESGIINLRPFADEPNYAHLCSLLTDPQKIAQLKRSSQAFVGRYHDADAVAAQYIAIWQQHLNLREFPRQACAPKDNSESL